MSHPIPAIIESAVDLKSIERQVQRAKVALDDADRLVDATGKKHESAVEAQRLARVELGRLLIDARPNYAHGKWLPFLERCGIPERTARDWMVVAGYVERKSAENSTSADLAPTNRDAGIERRPRKADREREEQPDPVAANWTTEIERRKTDEPAVDIDRELSRIHNKVCSFAESIPALYRKRIAHQLRETARLIEGME